MRHLANRIYARSRLTIIICPILPRSGSCNKYNRQMARLAGILKSDRDYGRLASNVKILDVFDRFLLNGKPNVDFFSDGLHLSVAGSTLYGSLLNRAVHELLNDCQAAVLC